MTLRNLNEPFNAGCVLYSMFDEERMRRVLGGSEEADKR